MLRELRNAAHLTQQELGERLGVGHAMVGHMESGRAYITPDRLCILRDVFDLNQSEFVALCEWAAMKARKLRRARKEAA